MKVSVQSDIALFKIVTDCARTGNGLDGGEDRCQDVTLSQAEDEWVIWKKHEPLPTTRMTLVHWAKQWSLSALPVYANEVNALLIIALREGERVWQQKTKLLLMEVPFGGRHVNKQSAFKIFETFIALHCKWVGEKGSKKEQWLRPSCWAPLRVHVLCLRLAVRPLLVSLALFYDFLSSADSWAAGHCHGQDGPLTALLLSLTHTCSHCQTVLLGSSCSSWNCGLIDSRNSGQPPRSAKGNSPNLSINETIWGNVASAKWTIKLCSVIWSSTCWL